jgi:hypothetical protein
VIFLANQAYFKKINERVSKTKASEKTHKKQLSRPLESKQDFWNI